VNQIYFVKNFQSRGAVEILHKGNQRFARATRVWREGNPRRGFPSIKPFPERFYLPSCAFEKRVFRRPRTAEQANYRPVFWLYSREYEKDFAQSKPTIRSRRARGFAPHPTAFEKAGETFCVAQTSIREDL